MMTAMTSQNEHAIISLIGEVKDDLREIRTQFAQHIAAHSDHASQRSEAHIANERRIATLEAEAKDQKAEIALLKRLLWGAMTGGGAGLAHYAANLMGLIGG